MKRLSAAVCLWGFLILLLPLQSLAEPAFQLTNEEHDLLEVLKKKPIKIAFSYELLASTTADGKKSGMLAPFMNMLENKLGLSVELVRLDWEDAFKALETSSVDFYGLIALSAERRAKYHFIDPLFQADLEIVTRVGRPLGDLLNLNNRKIGTLTRSVLGKNLVAYLYPHGEVRAYTSMENLLDALQRGEINCLATVDHAEIEVLKRPGLRYEFTVPNAHFQQGFISNNAEMRPLIALINRYLGTDEGRKLMEDIQEARGKNILLAAQETRAADIEYLRARHKTITIYDPGMQDPLLYVENDEQHGLQDDINRIFTELTGIPIETRALEELPRGMNSALRLLKSGEAMAITGMTFNVDLLKDEQLEQSIPVWRDTLRLYARADANLKGVLNIGVLAGDDNYAGWLSDNRVIAKSYLSYPGLLNALDNKEIDAIFTSEQFFDYMYNIRRDYSLQKVENLSASANVRVLLNRENEPFNRIMHTSIMLQQMIDTQSRTKWLNKASDYKYQYLKIMEDQKNKIWLVGSIFIFMLCILVYLLRRHIVFDGQISRIIRNQQNFDLIWGDIKSGRFSSKGSLRLISKWGFQIPREIRTMDDIYEIFNFDVSAQYRHDMEDMRRNNLNFIVRDISTIAPIDGQPRHYRRYLHRLNDRELMACLLDITDEVNRNVEQEANERALRQAVEAAREASRTKSMFLANMSHEIRTPMNGIIGFVELALEDENLPRKTLERLRQIRQSADGLLCIINDILDLSKIEAGQFSLEKIPFDLREVLRDCETICSLRAEEKGLGLLFKLSGAPNRKLFGDPTKLRQVLLNLLSNAIKFTGKGTVRLDANIEERDGKADLRLEVTDTGMGIPADKIDIIFESFKQADNSTTRQFGGTGLGLAIVKNTVEMMGGSIALESAPGSGSKFTVKLSLDISEEAIGRAPGKTTLKRPKFSAEALVSEDNRINQQVIMEHLAKLGIKVVVVENGKAAVEEVKKREALNTPFDIILMDIHMPVMDGLEATRLLVKEGIKTPIVAMTANAMARDKETYLKAGMADYISKPFQAGELWACLLRHIVPVGEEEISSPSVSRSVSAEKDALRSGENNTKSNDKVVDMELGLERANGSSELYRKLLVDFFKDHAASGDRLTETCRSGDLSGAHIMAHTLKSVAATIGAMRLSAMAGDMELALKDGASCPGNEQMRRLDEEMAAVLRFIEPLYDVATPSSGEGERLDRDKAIKLCAQLRPLLKTWNMKSMELLEHIREDFLPLGEPCATLISRIEDCDFDLALDTLGEIESILEKHE